MIAQRSNLCKKTTCSLASFYCLLDDFLPKLTNYLFKKRILWCFRELQQIGKQCKPVQVHSFYSTLRNNLENYCDKATDSHETIIVTRKNEKNIVILSLERYNQLEKAARNAEYLAMINKSIAQLETGKSHEHELIEIDY